MSRHDAFAVTGVGAVTALGAGAEPMYARLLAGEQRLTTPRSFDVAEQRCRVAAVLSPEVERRLEPLLEAGWSRSDAMAKLAAEEALADAGHPRVDGLIVGATTGGMLEAEPLLATAPEALLTRESVLASYPTSSTARRLSELLPDLERQLTLCSACSSSALAILQAARWLRQGLARCVLVGGTDALCRLTFAGFDALGALDTHASRPFDAARAGLSLGEGAAFLVLVPRAAARAGAARVRAWLVGGAEGGEAHHITQPEPSGRLQARLVTEALGSAGWAPEDVDYVNAHGTGTPHNDGAELRGLGEALGAHAARVLVSSSKPQLGHTLGAAGALEAVVTVLALEQGVAPPTLGLTRPELPGAVDYVVGHGRRAPLRAALSSSFGFGGTGAVLAFAAAEPEPSPAPPLDEVYVSAFVTTEGGPADPLALLEPARSRRFDRASAWLGALGERLLERAALPAAERRALGLVVAQAHGNVGRTAALLRRLHEQGPRRLPPAEFPHLLPSAAVSNAAIYLGLEGAAVSTSAGALGLEASLSVGRCLLLTGERAAALVGVCEPADELTARVFEAEGAARCGAELGLLLLLERRASVARRGAPALARLVVSELVERGRSAARLPEPRPGARLVTTSARAALERELEGSAWRGLLPLELAPGRPSGASGVPALLQGLALVAAGAPQVLCVNVQREGCGLYLLEAPG